MLQGLLAYWPIQLKLLAVTEALLLMWVCFSNSKCHIWVRWPSNNVESQEMSENFKNCCFFKQICTNI